MSKHKPEPIKNTVQDIIKQLKKKGLVEEDDIIKRWKKAAGKKINAHTKPVIIKDSVLIVNVESSGWLFELQTKYKNKLLKKIKKNTKRPKIENIRFRLGEIKDGA